MGFLTNLINGIGDYTTAYYGCLSVLLAVSAAFFAQKGYFEKLSRVPLIILVYSLSGGGLGSVLTWALYGFDFGTGISAPLAHRIYDAGTLDLFWSQFTADMLIDCWIKPSPWRGGPDAGLLPKRSGSGAMFPAGSKRPCPKSPDGGQ